MQKCPPNKCAQLLFSQNMVLSVAVMCRSAMVIHAVVQFPGERHVQQYLLEVFRGLFSLQPLAADILMPFTRCRLLDGWQLPA